MPGCVLRLSGPHAELAEAVGGAFLRFAESGATARAGKSGQATRPSNSTFNYTVSDADGCHVPQQIKDAEAFVSAHLAQLADLRSRPGVESGVLDFGWEIPVDAISQFNRFPASFLAGCAAARLDIEVSVYLDGRPVCGQ